MNPDGLKVGYGVTIRDDTSWGFHTTVARIIGQNGNTFAIDTPLNLIEVNDIQIIFHHRFVTRQNW